MLSTPPKRSSTAVIAVHLKGHFAHHEACRGVLATKSKAGEAVDARIITPSRVPGCRAVWAQANYSAAKAGIAALTLVAAAEMSRIG